MAAGYQLGSPPPKTRAWCDPSALMTQTLGFSISAPRPNAICFPFGDHAGESESSAAPLVRLRMGPPVIPLMTAMWLPVSV